jgi:hypothetical protein
MATAVSLASVTMLPPMTAVPALTITLMDAGEVGSTDNPLITDVASFRALSIWLR